MGVSEPRSSPTLQLTIYAAEGVVRWVLSTYYGWNAGKQLVVLSGMHLSTNNNAHDLSRFC